ncbi:MAG: PhnD/SsuA/transferrin family substrate-binding protein [Candidatus Didemnitutus sp.]|nr:PhnD/SsuA/transferrin family substrate-binding protein [Candidatus Didemnitutus sp.]
MEIALSRAAFSNVNPNDVVSAWSVALERMGRQKGYQLRSNNKVFTQTEEFATALRQERLHLAIIDTWQFLDLEQNAGLEPLFVPVIGKEIGRQFVVLVRRGSGIRNLRDLRGHAVAWLESSKTNACRGWLESLLATDAQTTEAPLFDNWEVTPKPTNAILAVFFGQKVACLVDENSFALMKELNPQVGEKLEVLVRSERFVDVIICLSTSGWNPPAARNDVINALANLGVDASGRQILALFKISSVVPFAPNHLDTVRRLRSSRKAADSSPPTAEAPR